MFAIVGCDYVFAIMGCGYVFAIVGCYYGFVGCGLGLRLWAAIVGYDCVLICLV